MRQPARILIVDDDRNNRELLEVMLGSEEFVLATAASGEEALAMVGEQPPDLVLLDVLMPGMGGYEVAGKLKDNIATKHIPIIIITALDDREARLSGLTAGAEDFLTRPLDPAELCVRVRNLLRLKTASDGALAERDNSMGMVSHDLRNLLNGIVLEAQIQSHDASASAEGQRVVTGMTRILRFASRMERLIEDLVDVVSIDAGKLSLEPGSHDVVALLDETIETHARVASERGITIRFNPNKSTGVSTFDRGRMLQVLGNLMTNALKFTPRGGVISLRSDRVDAHVQISVSDNGKGIPPDMLAKVFERFMQVGENDLQGLGLGLYISRCIVESHGGRLWVESQIGEGSTFYFTIPDVSTSQGAR